MSIFLISDTFFGRKTYVKRRGYRDIEEMDSDMINIWNSTVSPNDIVYHLGNFAWGPYDANYTLQQLNGEIRFIKGPFDKALEDASKIHGNSIILKEQIVELKDLNCVISHYPLMEWNGKKTGSVHFHGNSFKTHLTDVKENRVNVAADLWKLKPQRLESLVDTIYEFKNIKV